MPKKLLITLGLIGCCTSLFAQDFKSFRDIKGILEMDISKVEDTLVKKGFAFEKTEGLVFKYKKGINRFEIQTTPKEVNYFFNDRSLFLKINSELLNEGYVVIDNEDTITVQNKPVKAPCFRKAGESVYTWSFVDAPTKKTLYAVRIHQAIATQKPPTVPIKNQPAQNEPDTAAKITDLFFAKFNRKEKEASTVQPDSGQNFPKSKRISLTLAGFKYVAPDFYTQSLPNFQLGYEMSSFSKKLNRSTWMSDIGYEVDLSGFFAMDYSWPDEYLTVTKFYLTYNKYVGCNLKYVDFKLEGGPFLNYNYGLSNKSGESAGFLSTGIHLGQHVQRGIGKSDKGYSKMILGFGFDQYIAFKGGYIGSVGFTIAY